MDDQGAENSERVMDMETAIGIAARIWCDPDYEYVIMNPDLAERIAALLMNNANAINNPIANEPPEMIDAWMDTAVQNQRNADYYQGLVVRCGEAIGEPAYVQDDGGIVDEVLCAKVPELVEALMRS